MMLALSSNRQMHAMAGRTEEAAAAAAAERLVQALGRGDAKAAAELLSAASAAANVDVNYSGAVVFAGRRAEVVLKEEEAAAEVRIEHEEEFRSDLTPLFLAAHHGLLPLLTKLLSLGADVNQRPFRGYATTAAVREGRRDVLEVLMKAGANRAACEEALLEASRHGRARLAEILMKSDFIRPGVAVHALVLACSRGFADVVDTLVKCGVDADATDRVLLRSLKPSLHANLDCTAIVAAIVGRQVAVVRQLLQAGVRKDTKVSLGAWSWDTANGEEFRVGAGLAEPYNMAWCAVEYFESTGTILRMLLDHYSPNALHHGRSLLHHAILCSNAGAADALLASGADHELPVATSNCCYEFRPIHMAARLGQHAILQSLCSKGCMLDSRTGSGDTALMLCARYKRKHSTRVLVAAGADLGLANDDGATAESIAASTRWRDGFKGAVLDAIRSGVVPKSSDPSFSPMTFVAACGDVGALEALLMQPDVDIDEQDENGFSPIMLAAKGGHVDAFRLLVFAGAELGESAMALSSQSNKNSELFEQVLLEFALEKGGTGGFYMLHCAARRGDLAAVRLLAGRGRQDVDLPNGDGYTPLMLAAREGHGRVCELLVATGARCGIETDRGETALSLARKNKMLGKEAEGVILDELARMVVSEGGRVRKHTKRGKGSPHGKVLTVVGASGVLRWGRSRRRNVTCKEAEIGGSLTFQKNRGRKGDGLAQGLFRVVTTKGKEFHFVCEGGDDAAELWVRGIRNAALVVEGADDSSSSLKR